MSDKLCVVMPVYNEQDAIGAVLEKWVKALDALGLDYTIRPYNDGSKDNSLSVMKSKEKRLPRIEVHDKPNGGHGNTILTGYREAAADGFDWIFQIDSDDEMGPEKFNELWSRRTAYDFLVGIRDGRVQALPRKVISFVSRMCVRIFYGKSVWDVNTPYRLMRVSAFREFYSRIPLTTFAPNVILSGLAARYRLRCFETRVPQHDRTTGEVSIKKLKLLKAAARSFGQTIFFALKEARLVDWLRYAMWMVLWLLVCRYVGQSFLNGLREFDFQWDPAKLLMMGDNPYLYTLEHKAIEHPGFMQQYIDANQFPSCLLLLAPWTLLPQLAANYAWSFCNVVFSVVFLVFLYKTFFEGREYSHHFAWVPVLLLTGVPWRVLVGNGQHLMFSLAFFMPAYYYATKEKWSLSGVLLALSGFKYTTIAPIALVFVVHKWWKPVCIALTLHIAANIWAGFHLHESPLTLIIQSLQCSGRLTAQGDADMASLVSYFGCGGAEGWATVGYVVFGLALLVIVLRKSCRNDTLTLSLLAVISNIMFYHRAYDFVSMIFPLAFVLANLHDKRLHVRVVSFLSMLNILWLFWPAKAQAAMRLVHIPAAFIPTCFVLQHMLFVAMMVCYLIESGRKDNASRVLAVK